MGFLRRQVVKTTGIGAKSPFVTILKRKLTPVTFPNWMKWFKENVTAIRDNFLKQYNNISVNCPLLYSNIWNPSNLWPIIRKNSGFSIKINRQKWEMAIIVDVKVWKLIREAGALLKINGKPIPPNLKEIVKDCAKRFIVEVKRISI